MTYNGSHLDPARLLKALAFAADKHRDQRRKTPRPLRISTIAWSRTRGPPFAELEECFGAAVAALVREVTDDKALPKAERKRLQIEHAAGLSPRAKLLKIADKICNLRDVTTCPPVDWPLERRRAYLIWAEQVVAGCRGINAQLDRAFDRAIEHARTILGV